VVRAFDFGESEGTRYLTMEYVPGTTLRELIDARGGLALTPALQIAKQVCRGLAAVHKAGIVHGDLKPQNVMVMGNGVAKLMDFGVARPRARQEQGGLLVAGTPLYMSPEQATGAELDDRTDIYSAGIVMFEMFTGRCPFRGGDIGEILQMHLNDPPPDPRTLRASLPEPLSQLILACLAKHRLQRPASAADLDRLLMRVRV
jgi:serine/threonine-protein kinase